MAATWHSIPAPCCHCSSTSLYPPSPKPLGADKPRGHPEHVRDPPLPSGYFLVLPPSAARQRPPPPRRPAASWPPASAAPGAGRDGGRWDGAAAAAPPRDPREGRPRPRTHLLAVRLVLAVPGHPRGPAPGLLLQAGPAVLRLQQGHLGEDRVAGKGQGVRPPRVALPPKPTSGMPVSWKRCSGASVKAAWSCRKRSRSCSRHTCGGEKHGAGGGMLTRPHLPAIGGTRGRVALPAWPPLKRSGTTPAWPCRSPPPPGPLCSSGPAAARRGRRPGPVESQWQTPTRPPCPLGDRTGDHTDNTGTCPSPARPPPCPAQGLCPPSSPQLWG